MKGESIFHTFPNHDTEKIKLCKIPETRNCVLKSFHLLYTNVQNKRSEGVTPQSGQRSYLRSLSGGRWAPELHLLTHLHRLLQSPVDRGFLLLLTHLPHICHDFASRKHAISSTINMMPSIKPGCLICHLLTLIIGSQLD